jgi:L-rhamnose isomerase/sugar isomerase
MSDDHVFEGLDRLEIETPSWGYGNSGTRFHVYPWPGAARTVEERIADAGLVHRLTGCCPRVAIHIPWDRVDDYAGLSRLAASEGIEIGAVNPNLFGEDDYRLGSLCSPDGAVRATALRHVVDCVEIARTVGSRAISLWLADGTSYAGQDDLRGRYGRLVSGLEGVYAALDPEMTLLVEYKFFEPAFYSTDLPDWGTAALLCRQLGPRARVLVDTGHHPQGTNIEQIVARLLAEDLLVGSVDPFELFLIMAELTRDAELDRVALMIDQSHNVEGKIDAMIQSVVNIQTAYAKALRVERERLAAAQQAGDVLGAHRVLLEAFETDVRPLLARHRERRGLPGDPVAAFREGGYAEQRLAERGIASVDSAYEQG